MKNLTPKGERILREFPETRNSDIALTIELWKEFHPDLIEDWKIDINLLFTLPRADNISRCRRLLNEKGLFLPTDPDVLKARRIKRKGISAWVLDSKRY